MIRERLLMGLLLAGLPVAGYVLLAGPALARIQALHLRIQAANAGFQQVPPFIPLGQEERRLLEDPAAPWRARIPLVDDDGARMTQVDRVVSQLSAALKARKVKAVAMRAVLDPVRAEFTVPASLAQGPLPAARPAPGGPRQQMAGWVLEVEIAGKTGDLFRALAAVAEVNALLEPVGLRWERAQARGPHRKYLLLRNLYLKP
jgi:hypothetical protein